jgi:sodium/potassium-transporting ATPase subunit beta
MSSKDKSYESSAADNNQLLASTDTIIAKRGFWDEVRTEARRWLKHVWNPQKKEFLKRDDDNWAYMLLFYLGFFALVAAYAALAFALYLEVYIDKNHPRTQGNATLLMGWPSLAFRPMPNYRTTLIRFEQGKPASYKIFSDHIQAYLLQYENQAQESEAFIDCTNLAEADRNKDRACRFQIDSLGPDCVWQRDYGYDEGKPCVLLKLNKIFNWEPVLYDATTGYPPELGNRTSPTHVGVTCEGENPIDQENIGPLHYWPPHGFPRQYYPYRNQEGYRAPLVMVRFEKLTNGVVINVWCKAWARNIHHHRYDDMGSIHFELLVD